MIDIPSLLMGKAMGGGGSSVTVEALSVTENGTYTAPTGKAYSPVTVNVSSEPKLPAEYQEVEYLTNDGNCWCVVSVPLITLNDMIEVSVSLDTDAPSTENAFVGYPTGAFWEIYFKSDTIKFFSGVAGTEISINRDTQYTITARFSLSGSYSNTFYWGRYNTSNYPFYGKMYHCRLYFVRASEEFVTSKLVACYRKADNVPGFYDVVNSVFYTNSGSGTFGIGPDVT